MTKAETESIKESRVKMEIYRKLKDLNKDLSFEEKVIIWQQALEDILFSMEDQRNSDGLMIMMEPSLAAIPCIFTENIKSIRSRLDSKEYTLIPRDADNYE